MFHWTGLCLIPCFVLQIAFTALVFPSLLAAYMGQAAFLMKNHTDLDAQYTFYRSIPSMRPFWQIFTDLIPNYETFLYHGEHKKKKKLIDLKSPCLSAALMILFWCIMILWCRSCLLANVCSGYSSSSGSKPSHDLSHLLYDQKCHGPWLFPSCHRDPHFQEIPWPDLYSRDKLASHGFEYMHCSRVPQHKWHWKCLWQAVFLSSEKTYI